MNRFYNPKLNSQLLFHDPSQRKVYDLRLIGSLNRRVQTILNLNLHRPKITEKQLPRMSREEATSWINLWISIWKVRKKGQESIDLYYRSKAYISLYQIKLTWTSLCERLLTIKGRQSVLCHNKWFQCCKVMYRGKKWVSRCKVSRHLSNHQSDLVHWWGRRCLEKRFKVLWRLWRKLRLRKDHRGGF